MIELIADNVVVNRGGRTILDRVSLRIEPGDLVADYLVDVPPYRKDPHLKLQVGQYVTTSVGVVCRRGQ